MTDSIGYYVEFVCRDANSTGDKMRMTVDAPTPIGPFREGDLIDLAEGGKSIFLGRISDMYTTIAVNGGKLLSQTTRILLER